MDNLEAYLKLYERQMTHFEVSQGVEWKGNFGVWTLLVAAIYYSTTETSLIIDGRLAIAVFLIPVVVHWLWSLKMHRSGEFDKKLWSRYRKAAREILLGANQSGAVAQVLPSDEEEYRGLGFFGRASWPVLQVGVTAGLSAILAWQL